jgi:TonB family protein
MKLVIQFLKGRIADQRLFFLIILVMTVHGAILFYLKPPLVDITKNQVNDTASKNVLAVTMLKRASSQATLTNNETASNPANDLTVVSTEEQTKSTAVTTPIATPISTPTSKSASAPKTTPKNKNSSTAISAPLIASPLALQATDTSATDPTPVYLSKPRFKNVRPSPDYPREARHLRQEGLVVIRVLIAKSGRVTQAIIQQSSGSQWLDSAAKDASLQAQFYPFLKDGIAYSAQADLPFNFVLK